MENSGKRKQDHPDGVREILRNLPNVNTSDDFERQLQRRIVAEREGRERAGFFRGIFKMPSLVYSVAALVLICGLAFYIAYKTHTFEKGEMHQIPNLAPGGSNESLPASGREEVIKPLPPSSDKIPSAKEQEAIANRNTAKVSGTGEGNDAASGRVEVGNTITTGRQLHVQSSESGSNIHGQQSEAGKAMPLSKSSVKPPPAMEKSVDMNNDSKLRNDRSIQPEGILRKAASIAPSMSVDSIQMVKPASPALMRSMTSPLRSPKAKFGIQSFHDSVSKRDSLSLDSLKRFGHMRDSSTMAPDSIKPF